MSTIKLIQVVNRDDQERPVFESGAQTPIRLYVLDEDLTLVTIEEQKSSGSYKILKSQSMSSIEGLTGIFEE